VRRLVAPAAVLTAALALVPASVAGTGAKRTITIGDNFYAPTKVTVKAGTTVTWKWPDDTGDSHDVKLKSGPKGAKAFHSEEAAAAYSFKRKLTVPGTYKIICTLHEEMKQTIVVKR
jgi:plastocyanin